MSIAILAASALCSSCRQAAEPPSVLLVVVDTLRADRVGALRADGAAGSGVSAGRGSPTPSIDAWAAGGVAFRHATTPAPFTMPAVASLMTGVYPDRAGVITHEPGVTLRSWTGQTLAEAARQAGLFTAAVVSNPWLVRERTAFDRGFDVFSRRYQLAGGRGPATARDVTDEAIRLLDAAGDRRFFVWAHYFDPHMPYRPPSRFAAEAGASTTASSIMTDFRSKGRALDRIFRGQGYSDEDLERARRLYEGEVRYADHEIGRLLAHLDGQHRSQRTLVVLASDHGESLGEHGLYFAHDFTLYQELVHVALILRGPGLAAGRRDDEVSLIDVVPTVCRIAALPCRGDRDGRDLFRAPRGNRTLFAAATTLRQHAVPFARLEVPGPDGRWKMALRDGRKLVRVPVPDGADLEVYDLGSDPAESRDLAATDPETTGRLATQLDKWSAAMNEARPSALPDVAPRQRKRDEKTLRSLGYLQ